LKNETKKRNLVNYFPSYNYRRSAQDGVKKYLLCQECENSISTSEKYMKILMTGNEKEKKNLGILEIGSEFKNYDFEMINRFLLSLLIKMNYCVAAPFQNVIIEDEIVEHIISSYWHPKKSSEKVWITAIRYFSEKEKDLNPRGMILVANHELGNVSNLVSVIFSGWEFYYYWNFEEDENVDYFKKYRIQNNKSFVVNYGEILESKLINNIKW